MRSMYSIFESLLELHHVTVADVSRATGINQSTLSNWKKRNNLISGKNAQKIADFFGVSVDYLMTGSEPQEYYFSKETAKAAQEIFQNPELRLLFDEARDADPEDLKTVHQMLLALKRKENGEV